MTKTLHSPHLIIIGLGAVLALVLGHCHQIPHPSFPIPVPVPFSR